MELAKDLIDIKSQTPAGMEFGRETIHMFCSPIFVVAMRALFDKGIKTTSCGSGAERGILPGITCYWGSLTDANKIVAGSMKISDTEFRIGAAIDSGTTADQFESRLMAIVDKFSCNF